MDLHISKLKLVKLIINIDNQMIIDKLIRILKSGEEDFWLELSELEKREIELGIKQPYVRHGTQCLWARINRHQHQTSHTADRVVGHFGIIRFSFNFDLHNK